MIQSDKPIHVVLDSSIFRSNPNRSSGPFKALSRLAKSGKVRIHIPTLVKREFLSQQYEILEAKLVNIRSTAESLMKATADDQFTSLATNIRDDVAKSIDTITKCADAEFEVWLKEVQAIEYPMTLEQANAMLEAYFAGALPFKAKKQRKDIPDGLIWRCVLAIAEQHDTTHFVVEDHGLRSAAEGREQIITHKSLESFIQTPACQEALTDERSKANLFEIAKLLPTMQENLIKELDSALYNPLDGITVKSRLIPDDNREGTIYQVGDTQDVSFSFNDLDMYGDDELGIPFEAQIVCTLNYSIFKSDYYVLDDDKQGRISIGERNEHFYDADEDYVLNIKGSLRIELDSEMMREEDLAVEDIRQLIETANYEVDLDEISVNGEQNI